MPELPEVETVRRGLLTVLGGRRIVSVSVRCQALRLPIQSDLEVQLTGKRVKALERRAKYLLLRLDGDMTLLAHLGMSGSFVVSAGTEVTPTRHDHLVWKTDRQQTIIYRDPRRFGLMLLVKNDELMSHRLISGLGIEPLSSTFTGKLLHDTLQHRKVNIKSALLDQRIVAGIGNIYASEALYYAKISPWRIASSLTIEENSNLVVAIKEVLAKAITAGGSSLRDHRRPSGEIGYFQNCLAVYGRTGDPCPNCVCKIGIQRTVHAGRSTFYCPTYQR